MICLIFQRKEVHKTKMSSQPTIIQESTFSTSNNNPEENIITIDAGTLFYNAPRTANDRIKIIDSTTGKETIYRDGFLSFWTEITQTETRDLGINRDCPHENRIWEYNLEGGHVVFEEEPSAGGMDEGMDEGSDGRLHDGDRFCILPLCPKCNSSHNRGGMKLRYQVKSPVLTWRDDVRTNNTERTWQ